MCDDTRYTPWQALSHPYFDDLRTAYSSPGKLAAYNDVDLRMLFNFSKEEASQLFTLRLFNAVLPSSLQEPYFNLLSPAPACVLSVVSTAAAAASSATGLLLLAVSSACLLGFCVMLRCCMCCVVYEQGNGQASAR